MIDECVVVVTPSVSTELRDEAALIISREPKRNQNRNDGCLQDPRLRERERGEVGVDAALDHLALRVPKLLHDGTRRLMTKKKDGRGRMEKTSSEDVIVIVIDRWEHSSSFALHLLPLHLELSCPIPLPPAMILLLLLH